MAWKWIDTAKGRKMVEVKERAAARDHPARSTAFPAIQSPIISKGVGHVSRVLPAHKLEDGSPATKGADGYTEEGYPIIESQATIDRIEKLNPTYAHSKGAYDECNSHAEED